MDSSLRTAAQQALEALEGKRYTACGWRADCDKAITALKAALVEDAMQKFTDVNQELQAALGCDHCNSPLYAAVKCRVCGRETPIIKHKIKGDKQPVAYSEGRTLHWHDGKGVNDAQLYLAPPQRKPLTEEEIMQCFDEAVADYVDVSDAEMVDFARAIERAHGIDGAPEERHFCPRCGKRTNGIHTCTPPVPLTDEVIAELWHQNGGFHHHFARAIERWLKGNP